MITGQFNSGLEPVFVLKVLGPDGEAREIEAVIDTGFSNYLTLPPEMINALALDSIGIESVRLADGGEIPSELCLARIAWNEQERSIEINVLESGALVGIALMI